MHSFNIDDGQQPRSLVLGPGNALYGLAIGGPGNGGIAYELTPTGSLLTLYTFTNVPDGTQPYGTLINGTDGALYGVTALGGTNGGGVVFRLDPNTGGYSVLHRFVQDTDGAEPLTGLLQGSDLALYGVTTVGGTSNVGTIFKLDLDGNSFRVLHSFTNTPDGASPHARLTQATNGVLYGATSLGGAFANGTIYRINTDGTGYQVLHSFTNTPDGASPNGSLVQASDGALYGPAVGGGSNSLGMIFKINLDGGGYQATHQFSGSPDGAFPYAGLTVGFDGELYGTTIQGGTAGHGSIYRFLPGGAGHSVVYSFMAGADGELPVDELTRGLPGISGTNAAGVLYGGTQSGGVNGAGVVFGLMVNPPLTITPLSNQHVVMWPAWAQNFVLQTTTNVATGPWTDVTNYVPLIGAELPTASNSTAFFRLALPQ